MPPTEVEFARHQEIVASVEELRDQHPQQSLEWALSQVRISRGTFYRYQAEVRAGTACISDRDPGGRPAKYSLNDTEVARLRYLVAKHDSVDFGLEKFMDDPSCTHETRELMIGEVEKAARRGKMVRWPDSLRRIARVTPYERAELRGKKHVSNVSLTPRKGLFWRDESGQDHYIKSHSVWVMDDESGNQPHTVRFEPHPEVKGLVHDKYLWKLCRQVLKCKDLYSGAWLGITAVGRERDQYRGEDIVRFMLACIDAQGTMPDEMILEKGRWKGNGVHGIEVHNGHEYVRWGGLDALIRITHVHDSKGKASLESDLRIHQRAMAHSGEDIGGARGEFEIATKHYLQIQRQAAAMQEGKIPEELRDPLALGFLTQDQFEELHAQKAFELNCRPKKRAAFGEAKVPNDLLQNAITPRPLPASERWRFLPLKKEATIIRGGLVQVSVAPYPRPFLFVVNGEREDIHLENGYRVFIAFDPQRPDLGCAIGNGESGARNRAGFGFGEIIMMAPLAGDMPYRDESEERGPNLKKRASVAARAGFAQPKRHHRDERAVRIRQTLDNEGRTTRISNRPEADMEVATRPAATRPRRSALPDAETLAARERKALEAEIFS